MKFNAKELTTVAHVDSIHAKLVTACDAGTINGIATLHIQTTTKDF